MDEMNKKPMGEDTLNDIVAAVQAEADTKKNQEHTGTVEVDEKFRQFFTTTVAVIPDDAMVSGSVGLDEDRKPKKKGLLGWLSGLFHAEEEELPQPATGEVLIPGKTAPAEEPAAGDTAEFAATPQPVEEPADETMQIDLNMMDRLPEPVSPADATGEIRLDGLEPAPAEDAAEQPAEKPEKKPGLRLFGGDGAEKPAPKKKEKKARGSRRADEPETPAEAAPVQPESAAPAAEPAAAAQPAAPAPAGPAAASEQPKKLTFEDIDIAAILAAGAAGKAAAPAEQPAPEEDADLSVSLLDGEEPAGDTPTREIPSDALLYPLSRPGLSVDVTPTGEVRLTPAGPDEGDALDDAPTREVPELPSDALLYPETRSADARMDTPTGEVVLGEPAPVVEHSTREPQVVAVEEPTGEVALTPEEPAEPAAEQTSAAEPAPAAEDADTAELKEKTRTAAVRLFGDEEPAEEPAEAPERELPPLEEPAPAPAEYEDPADADAVTAALRGELGKHTLRAALSGIAAAVLLALGLSAQGILPFVTPIDPALAPQAFLGVNLLLLLAAAGVCWPVFAQGLTGLVGKASPHTLPALTALAALVQLAACLLLPDAYDPAATTVFAPMAALLLFADALGSRMLHQTVLDNFGLVSAGGDHAAAYCLKDKKLAETLTAGMGEKEPDLLLSRPATLVKDFMAQSFSARRSDATAQKLARLLLAGAAVGALLSLVRGGGLLGAVTALSGVLCLGAPLSVTLIAAVPSLLMQRAAAKMGAVVPGWYDVEQLGRVDVVQVDASALFGPGCAQLEGIKTFRKERIDLAILYATSVLIEGCNTLSGLFSAMIQDKREMLYEVKDLQKKPGLGFVAWCDNCRVVLGNRAMMAQEDVALPPLDYENRYTENGKYQALYLAVSGQLYALFVLNYRGERKVLRSLDTFKKENIRLLVSCEDPTLTADRIEKIYRLEPGFIKVLSADEQAALEPATRYMPASEGCMVHDGSFTSFARGLQAAAGAEQGERSACQVQTVAVAFSLVLGLLLAFTGGVGALSLLALVLYQVAWSGLSVAIALTKKY